MEQLQELKEIFTVGEKYSLYNIDSMMAMTHKQEILVRETTERGVVFTKPRGRKRFIIRFESQAYQSAPYKAYESGIFKGWEQPILCDTEKSFGVMRGNACYNFIGKVEDVRSWILENQLNPFFDLGAVVAVAPEDTSTCGDAVETVVFPEKVQPGNHAVIDRIMTKAS